MPLPRAAPEAVHWEDAVPIAAEQSGPPPLDIEDEEQAEEQAEVRVSIPPELLVTAIDHKPRGSTVLSLGFELEMELSPHYERKLKIMANSVIPRMEAHRDGSIAERRFESSLEVTYWAKNPENLYRMLDFLYDEDEMAVNDSCGFHLHVKVDNAHLWRFRTKGYWDAFLAEYVAYSNSRSDRELWLQRLSNSYCRADGWKPEYLKHPNPNRYQAINLVSIAKHPATKTVEHRIFPGQETAEEAKATIRHFYAWWNRVLPGPLDIMEGRLDEYVVSPAQAFSKRAFERAHGECSGDPQIFGRFYV